MEREQYKAQKWEEIEEKSNKKEKRHPKHMTKEEKAKREEEKGKERMTLAKSNLDRLRKKTGK